MQPVQFLFYRISTAVDVLRQRVVGWERERDKTVQSVICAHLRHCFRKTMIYRRTMHSIEDINARLTFIHEKRALVSVQTRMVSFNNTSPSLAIGLFSLEHQPFNCVGDMKIWLFAHFVTARCIDTILFIDVVLVFRVLTLYVDLSTSSFWTFFERSSFDVFDQDTNTLRMIVLKKELKLISTYISIVYVYTCLISSSIVPIISHLTFLRWLAEAAFLPQILMMVMCGSPCNLFVVA